MWRRTLLWILVMLVALPMLSQNESAKAKFIRDLTNPRFVEWPSHVGTINVAIVLNQALHDELLALTNRKMGFFNKNIQIRYYQHPREIERANIVYIHHKDFVDLGYTLNKFKDQPVLVVGENYPFRSSMINFIDRGEATIFEINEHLIQDKSIDLKNALLKKRASSESQWILLLAEAESDIQQKEKTIERKDVHIAIKQKELQVTADSLEETAESLDSTNVELAFKSDSLTTSQLIARNNEERLVQERRLRIVFIAMILIALGFLSVVLNNYRIKKRHAETLTRLNEELEERNREILDSITYARRIQSALLPSDKIVREHLEESFIIYKPKDIVSGDFYWMETFQGKILYAAADCTGHGVPGAFVSIVGYDGLNRALREFNLSQPSLIMDKLNEFVDETFDKSEEEIKDGMDMALCAIDLRSELLEYAGANNPLYIIREKQQGHVLDNNGEMTPTLDSPSHELYEIKPDKQPIGRYGERHLFTNHRISLKPKDTFYTFSDGFADQFGGPKGKKFKYKPFKELLLGIQHKSMLEQKQIISGSFESWKNPGDNDQAFDQIDDVVVIGVRFEG